MSPSKKFLLPRLCSRFNRRTRFESRIIDSWPKNNSDCGLWISWEKVIRVDFFFLKYVPKYKISIRTSKSVEIIMLIIHTHCWLFKFFFFKSSIGSSKFENHPKCMTRIMKTDLHCRSRNSERKWFWDRRSNRKFSNPNNYKWSEPDPDISPTTANCRRWQSKRFCNKLFYS